MQKDCDIRQKAVEFIGDGRPEEKMPELKELLAGADQRMEALQQEWERVSQELESSTDALKEAQAKVRVSPSVARKINFISS